MILPKQLRFNSEDLSLYPENVTETPDFACVVELNNLAVVMFSRMSVPLYFLEYFL